MEASPRQVERAQPRHGDGIPAEERLVAPDRFLNIVDADQQVGQRVGLVVVVHVARQPEILRRVASQDLQPPLGIGAGLHPQNGEDH